VRGHDLVRHFLVLLEDAGLSIQNEHDQVAAADRVFGAFDTEELDRVVDATLFADAGGIDEDVALPDTVGFNLERHIHRIAGRARNGGDDHALGLRQGVDYGTLPDVGPADDGQLEGIAPRRLSPRAAEEVLGKRATADSRSGPIPRP